MVHYVKEIEYRGHLIRERNDGIYNVMMPDYKLYYRRSLPEIKNVVDLYAMGKPENIPATTDENQIIWGRKEGDEGPGVVGYVDGVAYTKEGDIVIQRVGEDVKKDKEAPGVVGKKALGGAGLIAIAVVIALGYLIIGGKKK